MRFRFLHDQSLSCVWLFVTPWTIARQALLSVGFSQQEYWSGLPVPSSGDLPNPGIKPHLQHCRWILYGWAIQKARVPESLYSKHSWVISQPYVPLFLWTKWGDLMLQGRIGLSSTGEGVSPTNQHWFLSLLRVWWTSDTVLDKVAWRRLQTPLGEGGGFLERLFVIQSLSHVWLFATPWTTACQASLSLIISQSLLKLMSIKSVMTSNHLVLCSPILLLLSIFPGIRVFSNESVLHIRWPKYWHFSFSISPSNEYSGLTSVRIDWFDLLSVQGTLKSLLQHHSSQKE